MECRPHRVKVKGFDALVALASKCDVYDNHAVNAVITRVLQEIIESVENDFIPRVSGFDTGELENLMDEPAKMTTTIQNFLFPWDESFKREMRRDVHDMVQEIKEDHKEELREAIKDALRARLESARRRSSSRSQGSNAD